jgi:YD repeat-containing protein
MHRRERHKLPKSLQDDPSPWSPSFNFAAARSYDSLGRLKDSTDPKLGHTQFAYNGREDMTQVTDPRNLTSRTDSRGVLSSYRYDALNRLTQTVHSKTGLTTQTFRWIYDQAGAGFSNGIGHLTSTAFPDGSSQTAYDAQGLVLAEIQRINPATASHKGQALTLLLVIQGYA